MRILLIQSSSFYPSFAGGDKSDRLMILELASRGHICRVIARVKDQTSDDHLEYHRSLVSSGVDPDLGEPGLIKFSLQSVEVHVLTTHDMRTYISSQLTIFSPDIIIVSTDPLNTLVEYVVGLQPGKVVYLARTTMLLPFGPDSIFPSAVKTEAIRRAAAVVTVSGYLADYIGRYSGISALHLPIQMMDRDEWPMLGKFNNPFVTMVNPCALKGVRIFLGLIDAFPNVKFAAVPTWGTTSEDIASLAARANVSILEPAEDIRSIFRRTRVLLVPSLWTEARPRIVVEALLSGVPVLASDRGGINEAAMGVSCLLPVNPIISYQRSLDERMLRKPEVPPQNIEPWRQSLACLIDDPVYYTEMAKHSRERATRYLSTLSIEPFESLLCEIAVRNNR